MRNIQEYKTIVFDCDGVLLNSNKIKVQAYYDVAKCMGGSDAQAQAFVDYHIAQGSFPRNGKIKYYLKHIVQQKETTALMQQYLNAFDQILAESLMQCELAIGLLELKTHTKNARWMVLSGGDQMGLRQIFERRDLTQYFECGIFGGPDIKEKVLDREKSNGNIQFPALFVGDSKYDHQASTGAGLDFVFLSDWTEVKDWQTYCRNNDITVRSSILKLLSL
ncbi:MAG: HAD hydrolase-like protein [Methylophilaceae bacterium]